MIDYDKHDDKVLSVVFIPDRMCLSRIVGSTCSPAFNFLFSSSRGNP